MGTEEESASSLRGRLLQVLSHSCPSGAFLHKIGKGAAKHCIICSKLNPAKLPGQIAPETTGHILSAWCAGQAEAATALHNKGVRLILQAIVPQNADPDKLDALTEDGELTIASLWAKKEISCLCTWEEVKAAAQQARWQQLQPDTLIERQGQTEQIICDHCRKEGGEQQRFEDVADCICCHWKGEMTEAKATHTECVACWSAWSHQLSSQPFDGVILDRRNNPKKIIILEFKRQIDTTEEYWQKGKDDAETQHVA